jgi:predicted permease
LPLAWERFPGGPVASSNAAAEYAPVLQWLKDDLVGSVANLLWILLGGVSVVLLVACANVANLALVRAEGKDTEMAVRTAMGADRRRIGWEYLKESLLLGVLGGVGGLVLAYAGLRILVSFGPEDLPRLDQVTLDVTTLLFALGASLFAGMLFGMFPVVRHGRTSVVDTLKQGGPTGTKGRRRHQAQNALAVSQMAMALVLLTASGLMLRSFQSLRSVDPGFHDPEDVLAFRVTVPLSEIQDLEEAAGILEAIARRLEAVPGVDAVAMATHIPMHNNGTNVNPFYVDGVAPSPDGPPPMRRQKWIGEGYFEGMRIPLLAGRTFTWNDVHNRFPGAIVSESLAREYWGSPEAALGQRVAARPEPVRWHEVVGVAADVKDDDIDQGPLPIVYWPQVTLGYWEGATLDQVQTWRGMGYAVRSARVGTPGFLQDIRTAVWEVSPNIPLRGVWTLPELMARSVARTSFTMVLLTVAAGVALLLGVLGVYGVISYTVSQQRHELGMRMALGARGQDLMRMVLGRGLALSFVGLAAGVALALGLTRLMAGLLFQISPRDPLTLGVVAAGLLIVALLASYLPARKAARLDPMVALRSE